MASSILGGLVTNDGIDRLRKGISIGAQSRDYGYSGHIQNDIYIEGKLTEITIY